MEPDTSIRKTKLAPLLAASFSCAVEKPSTSSCVSAFHGHVDDCAWMANLSSPVGSA